MPREAIVFRGRRVKRKTRQRERGRKPTALRGCAAGARNPQLLGDIVLETLRLLGGRLDLASENGEALAVLGNFWHPEIDEI